MCGPTSGTKYRAMFQINPYFVNAQVEYRRQMLTRAGQRRRRHHKQHGSRGRTSASAPWLPRN